MAQLNALNELLSGVQRSIAMGVPGLEERRGQIMSDIQLLLLGPQQVQEPAPAATGAVYYFSDGHTPVSPPLAPVTQAYTMRAPRPNMPPASLAAAQAPQTEAPQAPQVGTVLHVRKVEQPMKEANQPTHRKRGQSTLHATFGNSILTKFGGASAGRMPVLEVEVEGATSFDLSENRTFDLLCSKGCGISFRKPSGRATHEKSCQGAPKVQKPKVGVKRASDKVVPEDGEDSDYTDDEESSPSSSSSSSNDKRADGRKRNSGSKHRQRYALSFKVHLLDQVKILADEGKTRPSPCVVVSGRYKLNETQIFKWKKQEKRLREAITSDAKEGSKYHGAKMLMDSKKARRYCLGGGRKAWFPSAEMATYDELCFYRRERGARVGPQYLSAMMRKHVAALYGPNEAKLFKASKKWRRVFAIRFTLSLRKACNKKALSALERLPKAQRWFARLRRRLQRGEHGRRAVQELALAASLAQESAAKQKQLLVRVISDAKVIVSAQGSHGFSRDCGLCALKNVTANSAIAWEYALAIARKLEGELEAEDVLKGLRSSARHFVEGVGNFSGQVLRAIASSYDYKIYRLSCEIEGKCGFARSLVEEMCIIAGSRLCGVIWREGPGFVGAAASQGHWIGATYLGGSGDWRTHKWVFKDSIGSVTKSMSAEEVMCLLDEAEKGRLEFGVVMDMA